MIVCKKCGWEIRQDFGMWLDQYEGLVCDFVGDVPRPHKPRIEMRTPNNSELAVA